MEGIRRPLRYDPAEQNKTGWRGTTEGTKLKVNGMSKFNAKLTGFLTIGSGASFIARGDQTSFWTSSEHIIGGFAYDRTLRSDKETIYRYNFDAETKGLGVRCLRLRRQ